MNGIGMRVSEKGYAPKLREEDRQSVRRLTRAIIINITLE